MNTIVVEEDEFIAHMNTWFLSGRNLVTLPRFSEHGLELTLSIISIDNTKLITLNKTFYTYGSIMGYYGKLLDKFNDE